ncbi:cell wall hydrolase [Stappia phage SI01]|uniref:Cell wall hydrolase n=1 Tax=Stappia phage SI01 TaxID=2847766 RepID=A0AAE7SQ20_9CAUD|nr:cell wall hydrolase [Stappia phage SI01]
MAQNQTGRRDVVQDPLRQSAQQVLPERALPLTGVRSPSMPSTAGLAQQGSEIAAAMGSVQGALDKWFEQSKDQWITDGKVALMSGVTEEALLRTGNRFTQMGYIQLKARNDVNAWYLNQQADLTERARTMSPEAYQEHLSRTRGEYLDTLTDPYARKVASAAFEQFSPDLAAKQFTANNDYNLQQREGQAYEYLLTGSVASPSRSTVDPNSPLKLAPQPVGPVMQLSAADRDIGIKTLIGEAGNQGDVGMAAVAHVLVNRTTDSRFPNSIGAVSLQGKGTRGAQFSIWGSTKANAESRLRNLGPGNPLYDKAASVFDAVMSGRHVDPTGGAINYYSPGGMLAYKKQGIQSHLVPSWASKAEAENLVVIGSHRFSGKSDGALATPRMMQEPIQGDSMVPRSDDPTSAALFSGPDNTAGTPAGIGIETMNAAPAEEGVSGIETSGAPNEIMDFLENYKGLPQERLTKTLARAMAAQLTSGDDTLFNDAGGVATLFKMGATPQDIDLVNKARSKWQIDQDKKFDEADLKFEDDILRLAGDGTTTRDEIFSRIDARVKAGRMQDSAARSLASRAAGEIRAQLAKDEKDAAADKNSIFSNTEFLQEIGGVYQQINAGVLDFEGAAEAAQELSDKYDASPKDVKQLLGRVFELDQARQNKLRSEAEKAVRDAESSNVAKNEAETALARGYGLGNVTRQVRVTTADGAMRKMSAKEYGIEALRSRALDANPGNPEGVARSFFGALQRQDVVDEKTRAQMVGGLSGPIIDEKTKKVNQSALEAYDLYMSLRNDPQISDEYLAKTVGDPYVRNLLELAYTLDAGNLTEAEALIRAKSIADDPNADKSGFARTDAFRRKAQEVGDKLIEEIAGPSTLSWLTLQYDQFELEDATRKGGEAVRQRIMQAADAYKLQFPWQDDAAALELAKQDVKGRMNVLSGNIILTERNLAQAMGISDKNNANDAFKAFIKAVGPTMWPDTSPGIPGTHVGARGGFSEAVMNRVSRSGILPDSPDRNIGVTVRWLDSIGENGAFQVWLDNPDKPGGIDLGSMQIFPAEEVGAWYAHNQSTPNVFERMFDTGIRASADLRRFAVEQEEAVDTARELGARVGAQE